jgi:hypothetical protein
LGLFVLLHKAKLKDHWDDVVAHTTSHIVSKPEIHANTLRTIDNNPTFFYYNGRRELKDLSLHFL